MTNNGCIDQLALLSELVLRDRQSDGFEQIAQAVVDYSHEDLARLWDLANSHHVIMRALPHLRQAFLADEKDEIEWLENALATERARIRNALFFLALVCRLLNDVGDVIVIKSLDHWPDLGNDLDLYTNAKVADVVAIMRDVFKASIAAPSLGDRLANKWNFVVPGLPEPVEVHFGRLGQAGEQAAITNSLVARATTAQFGLHAFRVPAVEERIMISTLQRMYRHFYLRLCDIANVARLADSGAIDYEYLRSLARSAGVWEGLSSYMLIVAEYAERYSGRALPLPSQVTYAARVSAANVSLRREFLRIPLFPQAVALYAKEWASLVFNGELLNGLRLSLLPGLALAAALAAKTTGSDKGIW